MRIVPLAAAFLSMALAGCSLAPSASQPTPPAAGEVSRSAEQGGRFIALVGPRRQHDPPFLGVPGTNFYALRSWLDTRSGERVHELYVEDSYSGAERNWSAARDGQGQPLKFVPISKNEITCDNGCSYAEEFGADLPEPLLRASTGGLTVVFSAKSGATKMIEVPQELIRKQLAAVDEARSARPAAAR